jgi:hypothetical protein
LATEKGVELGGKFWSLTHKNKTRQFLRTDG